jgi:crossover junction endodeoxyribonuclease RuvC
LLCVLGIDPGSLRTGYGILEEGQGKIRLVTSGVIQTKGSNLSERLAQIYNGLERIIHTYQPQAAAVEEVFHARNAKSALVLGHARGVAMLAAALQQVPVFEYPTRKVKKTVTGSGDAEKEQVRSVLKMILGEAPQQLDASDAVAVALCHLRWSRIP